MASGELRVDTPTLRSIGTDLHALANEFSTAEAHSENAAAAVGHPGLADAVRAFAQDWEAARAGMVEDIERLGHSASGVGDAFDSVDSGLGSSLQG